MSNVPGSGEVISKIDKVAMMEIGMMSPGFGFSRVT